MKVNREDLAWAAGIFEGEGYIGYSPKSRGIQAVVTSTDKDVLEAFHGIVGFGCLQAPVQPPKENPHWKIKYRWACTSFEETQALVALLWPWLKSRRRSKAKLSLQKYIVDIPDSFHKRVERTTLIKMALKTIENQPRGNRWTKGITQSGIAKQFGVSPALITQIKHEMVG